MAGEEVLIPLVFFGSMGAIAWKFFDSRHKERMTIIEKGLVKEELKYLYSSHFSWKTNPFGALKYGMLAAFIGLGILVSAFFTPFFWGNQEQFTTGIVFLFGGIGLILFYALAAKKEKQQE